MIKKFEIFSSDEKLEKVVPTEVWYSIKYDGGKSIMKYFENEKDAIADQKKFSGTESPFYDTNCGKIETYIGSNVHMIAVKNFRDTRGLND